MNEPSPRHLGMAQGFYIMNTTGLFFALTGCSERNDGPG